LVLIFSAYNTVFNSTGTPACFEYILGIDWCMDRFRTTLNVTGDCVVCALVATMVDMDDETLKGDENKSKKLNSDEELPDE
jgi:Na+/H+-dicarboxylate symporter